MSSRESPTTPDTPTSKGLHTLSEPSTAPSPQASPSEPVYAPMTTWVQGGTTTWEHDKQRQKLKAEAEERRRKQDTERAMANRPLENGGAKMHSAELTAPTDPKVLLRYKDMEILCELTRDDNTGKRMLVICCPECVMRGEPADQSQFVVREEHRKWDIDTREAGQMKVCLDTEFFSGRRFKQVYMSAGVVMDSETFVCPHYNCGVRYQIDKNMLIRVR
jgi:hypothetical protein